MVETSNGLIRNFHRLGGFHDRELQVLAQHHHGPLSFSKLKQCRAKTIAFHGVMRMIWLDRIIENLRLNPSVQVLAPPIRFGEVKRDPVQPCSGRLALRHTGPVSTKASHCFLGELLSQARIVTAGQPQCPDEAGVLCGAERPECWTRLGHASLLQGGFP